MVIRRKIFMLAAIVPVLLLASGAESGEEPATGEDAYALLEKTAAAYYDLDEAGLNRAACYLRCNEILKTLDATARRIVQRTTFEGILQPGKGIQVKTRKIPANFGAEARAGIERYRWRMQASLTRIFKKLDVIRIAMRIYRMKNSFDAAIETGKKGTRLIFTRKNQKNESGRRGWRSRRQSRAKLAEISIWLGRNNSITRIEIVGSDEKSVITIKPRTQKSRWMVRVLDVATYDSHDRLKERSIIEVDYTREKGLTLPARITIKTVDKKGKPIQRRNEANPVSVQMNKYEVEKR